MRFAAMRRMEVPLLMLLCLAACGEDELIIARRPQKPPLTAEDLARYRKQLVDRDPNKIEKTVAELTHTNDPNVLPLLNNLYDTGDAPRRLIAVRGMEQLGAGGQDDALLRISVGDPFIAIRMAASSALGRSPRSAQNIDQLVRLVDGPAAKAPTPPIFQHRAVQSLARIGGPLVGAHLAGWLTHPSTEVASAAADGLGSLGETAQAEALFKALGTSDIELKPAVADALERISGENYRFDLVRWTDWLKTKSTKKSTPAPSSENTYDGVELPSSSFTDIVVVFDTTGSMTHIWPQLCNAVDAVLAQMIRQSNSLRMGLVLYRADSPEVSMKYTIKPITLTRNHAHIRALMDDATFGGGSGGVNLGMDFALKAMPWRAHARKIVILIGDTSPTPAGVQACAQSIREAWEMDRILTTTLYVRTLHGDEHRQTYRLLASSGVGRFYEYNKAESQLVELMTEKEDIDVKQTERPEETARKWFLPREKK